MLSMKEHRSYTFPSFAREDGSEDHEMLPSVNLLLLGRTLTKLPGSP